MPDATFACSDLTTFTSLNELGLEVIGQRLEPDCAVLACRDVDPDDSAGGCRRCGCDLLYNVRRTLHTGADLLTGNQAAPSAGT